MAFEIGAITLLLMLLAAAAGIWISRRFSTPIESQTRTMAQMAAGNLSARSSIERQDEFGLLSNTFNQMADSIEIKAAALRHFVADAAHELHTTLTALRANLELSETKQALKLIERLDNLTRSLLDLSRLEVDAEHHFGDMNLGALLQKLAEPYASRAEHAGVSFKLEVEGAPVIVRGDAPKLRTLVQNLIENAIKLTPDGGEVTISLKNNKDNVQLTVNDTGIPEDDIPQLFSRFHRGRNASAYPGSGLGLAIVKAIADQHRGRIRVDSDASGTQFVVEFIPYPPEP